MNKLLILLMAFVTSLVFALPEDAKQPIEIEAQSVVVDETTGLNMFSGNAEVRQGSLLLLAEFIQVQTDNDEVVSMIAQGSLEKPAKYIQRQENQERFIEATATLIKYDVLILFRVLSHLVVIHWNMTSIITKLMRKAQKTAHKGLNLKLTCSSLVVANLLGQM